jgi:enamine deaminase RidA (YjgF/YER057c/UK114 family)
MSAEQRLAQLGLVLPPPAKVPPNVKLNFAWARRHGNRVLLSGHGPQAPDGSIVQPFGQVGGEVSPQEAYQAARLATLGLLGTLRRTIGSLDHVAAWLSASGYVAVAPGFTATTNVINGCSDLLVEIFGPEIGRHARTAIGVSALPINCPVVIAAEVALAPGTP